MAEEKHGVVNELIGQLCLHAGCHGADDVIKLVPGVVEALMFGPTRTKTHRSVASVFNCALSTRAFYGSVSGMAAN